MSGWWGEEGARATSPLSHGFEVFEFSFLNLFSRKSKDKQKHRLKKERDNKHSSKKTFLRQMKN